MKTIGILGGMSAASTQIYYSELCRLTQLRQGGLHSPNLLIRSLDFAQIAALQARDAWDDAAAILNQEAKALERGGADLIILATNTMHKLVGPMMTNVQIPFLHIADATASCIVAAGHSRPGLMATSFTMEQNFYTDRLRDFGLATVLPNAADRAETHRIIYDELCKNLINETSATSYVEIAKRLAYAGADCLILGCTEVGLLLNPHNTPMPIFDTTKIHCAAAFDAALAP